MSWPGWYPPILAYHRVHPEPGTETPTVSPDLFRRQMRILAVRWRPIPLAEMVSALETRKRLPPRAVVVTFDDGTEDNFTHAFPALLDNRIPATVFMIAGNVGKPGSLSAEQILKMRRGGIDFGSHTFHHAYLPELPADKVREELAGSRDSLRKLGLEADFLSYPGGGFTPELIRAVQEAGYRGACTTNRGTRRFPPDRWALRRISMHGTAASPWEIRLRCSGFYGLNRRLRTPA